MSWKKFLTASAISLMVAFPQNMIGCGGWLDPYDYYISFYWNDQVDQQGYEPFYYTGELRWYTDTERVSMEDVNTRSWQRYFDNKPADTAVHEFIYGYSYKQLSDFYNILEKGKAYTPSEKNEVIDWFIASQDLEALGYILYAKQVEPNVTGAWDNWEPIIRDSIKMSGLIKNGLQLYKAAKKEEIRLRYAYQLMRLAQYSNRPDDCINFYDLYVKNNTTRHFLKAVCLAHKAGAFFRKGEADSAAYLFSQAFAQSEVKRLSNLQSFEWACVADSGRERYLRLCKTNTEKANMLGMFALHAAPDTSEGIKDEIHELKMIASLDPSSPLLEIITAREINKIEEFYFTPSLARISGKELEYYSREVNGDASLNAYSGRIKQLEELLASFSSNPKISNSGFYALAVAYLAFMQKDYTAADEWLTRAKALPLNSRQEDQWHLTRLLVTINKQKTIDAAFETSIVPQLKWLAGKAGSSETWEIFYRHLYIEVLGEKYRQQKNIAKQALCISAGRRFGYGGALSFLRENMNSTDLLNLNSLLESKKRNAFEEYVISFSTFGVSDVKDVIATSFIRENNWTKAEEWLKKIPAAYYAGDPYKTYLAANSFADLLYDTHIPTKQDTVKYTKLKFVRKMMQLEKQLAATSDNNLKARTHYQLANGLYQMSYWGNSWMLQAYDWSGSEAGWEARKSAWAKEYYGVNRAEENYKRAYSLSTDPEFRARCLFMAAKCYQKRFDLDGIDESEIDKFKETNSYFPQLVKNYNTTRFYKHIYTTCSYFSDFVKKTNK